MTTVTVVVPTYDESGNIDRIVTAVRATGAVVIVVDDASPDGTGFIADRIAGGDPHVSVIHRAAKQGLGSAYVAGFAAALRSGAEVICQIDADLSHDPEDLPRLVAAVGDGADLAIGSRYVPGGATVGWSWHRRLLSRGGNRYAALMLGLPIADATAGFRAWSAAGLGAIDAATCATAGYGFQVETAWRAVRAGLAVVEIPIVFTERTVGTSKMSPAIAFEAMRRVTGWGLAERFGRSGSTGSSR
jgi:dolichol-phosphate mannosyltransferase